LKASIGPPKSWRFVIYGLQKVIGPHLNSWRRHV
jgi:hypothetical protein